MQGYNGAPTFNENNLRFDEIHIIFIRHKRKKYFQLEKKNRLPQINELIGQFTLIMYIQSQTL